MTKLRPGYGDEIRLGRTPLVPDGERWHAKVYEKGTLLYCVATGDTLGEVLEKVATINSEAKLPVVDAAELGGAGGDEGLKGLVRKALKDEADRLYVEASGLEIPNSDSAVVSKFYELTGRAERIERALRRGGWDCMLGHRHDLTEGECLTVSLLLVLGEPGIVEVAGGATEVLATIEGARDDG